MGNTDHDLLVFGDIHCQCLSGGQNLGQRSQIDGIYQRVYSGLDLLLVGYTVMAKALLLLFCRQF